MHQRLWQTSTAQAGCNYPRAEFGLLMSDELPLLQELQGVMLFLFLFFFSPFFFPFPSASWEILSCSLFPPKPWVALNSRHNCMGELQRFEGIKLESLWLKVQAPTGILSGAARRDVAGRCSRRNPYSRDNLNVRFPSTDSEARKSITLHFQPHNSTINLPNL